MKGLAPHGAEELPAVVGRPWLGGDRFSVADLNVASVLAGSSVAQIDLGPYPNVQRWATACWGRPASERGRARR